MYSPANTQSQSQLNSRTPQGQPLRASTQSTLFKFASRARLSATNLGYIKCLKNWQENLCLEEVDLPIDEGEEDGKENQEDQEGQGDTLEGQGHGDDDDGVGIGIIPLDN